MAQPVAAAEVATPARTGQRTARRRLLADAWSKWAITAGGLAIIASILGILFFIFIEVWPLFRDARVEREREVEIAGAAPAALLGDEHRTHVAALGDDGVVRAFDTTTGESVLDFDLLATAPPLPALPAGGEAGDGAAAGPAVADGVAPAGVRVAVASVYRPPGGEVLAAATSDGRVATLPVTFPIRFEGSTRVVEPLLGTPVWVDVDPTRAPVAAFAARRDDDGSTVFAQLAGGELVLVEREVMRNAFTGEETASETRRELEVPYRPTHLLVDGAGTNLYAATATGELLWWRLRGQSIDEVQIASAGPSPITAMTLLVGDRGLVVGQEDGSLSVWFTARQSEEGNDFALVRIRDFPAQSGAVRLLSPSMRNKGFLAAAEGGEIGLYYSTSKRVIWSGQSAMSPTALSFSPKSDGAYLAAEGRLAGLEIDNPHPEISWKTLFGKVWYEGYTKPEHVWQSTGGTDDFESKLSLTPLLVGTLKGTIYSLLLAIPLGVFGGMYASQFMHPNLVRYVKPTVEIMAALPSVVLGFLAGLWLAPRLERYFPALILAVFVLPLLILAAGTLWQMVPRRIRGRFWSGSEVLLFTGVIAVGAWLCVALSGATEQSFFGGSFQAWLLEAFNLPYDQRNAVVIGLAMGFAVIPIIFAISEDAFSNVPRNLVAGSLALGANRWQTVTRIVLPSASPGIFSAIMVGFGRAVGETMIVLMATGNTPIMDWNPFNGFRTLSANIAVEIPEAPHGGTLYRLLFMAALLLFVVTFLVNTVAELVRQRLRKRYSQL